MRNFFNIETAYKFEWNDLRAFTTLVNVILIILFGLQISWFGLAIAVFGLVRDFTTDRHFNGIVMHLSMVVLNSYFLYIFYFGS